MTPAPPPLSDARVHRAPYPFFTCEDALGEASLAALDALFDAPLPWGLHDQWFYRCHVAVVTDRIGAALQAALAARVGELLGLPLCPAAEVTAQRMDPGHYADRHTDSPALGYEAARLVVQLTPGWSPGDGGELQVYPDGDGAPPVLIRPPRRGTGFGFGLSPRSHHAVAPVRRTRRTVVFNFWHRGNTPALKAAVDELFDGLSLAALPRALDPLLDAAERGHPVDQTTRAGLAAAALGRLGYGEATQAAGFSAALGALPGPPAGGPDAAAVGLVAWLVGLRDDGFDAAAWAERIADLVPLNPAADPRIGPLWALAADGS